MSDKYDEKAAELLPLNMRLKAAERERDELQTVIEEKSRFIGSQIDEIHGLEHELEQARGGPAKNEQWKKLVSQRDAAYIAGLEAARDAIVERWRSKNYDITISDIREPVDVLIDAKKAKP